MPAAPKTRFVSIEGNIGAGKTTLLNRLVSVGVENYKHWIPLYEPVDAWMNLSFGNEKNTKSLFELFYDDMHAHAFTFQLMTLLTRIEQLQKAAVTTHQDHCVDDCTDVYSDTLLLCDRSYMADANVFAAMLHASGHLSDEQYGVYNRWYDNITRHGLSEIQHVGTIYLRSKPEQCLTRITQRHRASEVQKIELSYLEEIHTIHETWLGVGDEYSKKNQAPVLLLDVDTDGDGNQNLDRLVKEAMAFIDQCIATPLPVDSCKGLIAPDLQRT